MVEALLVHGQTIGIHGLTKLTMAQTWGSHHLSPCNILYAWP